MKHALPAVAFVCAAILAGTAARPVAEQAADPLAKYESTLESQPDDIRAGNDYRMAVIQNNQYDRAIAFWQKLVAAHPAAANAHLNFGFEYVDKIPVAGAITQVILANNALGEFSKAIEIKPSWIALYTRGNSYLFWPRIFNRTQLGINDLQEALKIEKAEGRKPYHARAWVALGDGFWKLDNLEQATSTWRAGLAEFPQNQALKARLSAPADQLKSIMDASYDPNKRVDTSLQDLWTNQ